MNVVSFASLADAGTKQFGQLRQILKPLRPAKAWGVSPFGAKLL